MCLTLFLIIVHFFGYSNLVDFVKFLIQSKNYTFNFFNIYNVTAKLNLAKTPLEILNINEVRFVYLMSLKTKNFKVFYENKNNLLIQFIRLNTKRGYQLKTIKTYNKSLEFINLHFNEFNDNISQTYNNYTIFFEFAKNFPDEFYMPDFFIKYIHNYMELTFLLKKVKPPKKLKKKKLPIRTTIVYIPKMLRFKTTLRIINAYILQFNEKTYLNKIVYALLYLLLASKQSFLYKRKVFMYNKLLEKKKFY